jgi:hypothetical protein
MTGSRARLVAVIAAGALIVLGVGAYLVVSLADRGPVTSVTLPDSPTSEAEAAAGATESYLAFRQTAVDENYGRVGTTPLDEPAAEPDLRDLSCERIHMSATSGVCLSVDRRAVTTAEVLLLDGEMNVRHRLATPGIPSRARVSPDGRWAATTTFVTGHSYAQSGFSTQTEIYDMASGESLGNVEEFTITQDGAEVTAVDVNVWGVTFSADGESFYATVKTGGEVFLARGDVSKQAVEMLDVPAECPSLSPSGKLLAYKAVSGPGIWEIRVRSLADDSVTVVAETRSVDDQIEWLDDATVVYGLGREGEAVTDVWAAPADGSGQPQVLIPQAWSPAVVRLPTQR